ncbi:MAG: hypothetical protein WAM88_09435 [Nitrososphaeraceae archaeon]
MNQKGIGLAAVLAATILTAVFTTTPPFSMKEAEGQTFPSCPVGYERNPLGTCEPIADQPPSEIREEQNTVCSGWSFTCGQ